MKVKWVEIDSFTRRYFISRSGVGADSLIDDEAQLEIEATIKAISPAHKKYLGQAMHVSLLSAQRYSGETQSVSAFFGSLTLRGSRRSALAYLPPKPFWELPAMIAGGARWLNLGWTSMHRGYADLTSLFVGDEADLQQYGAECVRNGDELERVVEHAR